MDGFQRKAPKTVGMRRKETDRIRLQRIVGLSTHPTRSDAPDFTWESASKLVTLEVLVKAIWIAVENAVLVFLISSCT